MGRNMLRFSVLALATLAAGCDGAVVDDTKEDEAVTVSTDAGVFSVDAPSGEYNAFSLDASCSHDEGPDGGYSIWTRAAYSIQTNLDCLDCFLPSSVVVGQAVEQHEIAACLPSDTHPGCDPSADVSGLVLADLLRPAVLDNGETVPVNGISVMFTRVHEAWDDELADSYGTTIPYPRVDIATAMLSTSSDGVVSVGSDWSFCDDALNSDSCFY